MKTRRLKASEPRDNDASDLTRPAVDVVAIIPPPVKGNTLITQRVIQWLRDHCDAHVCAISSSDRLPGLAAKGVRAWKNLAAFLWLLTKSRRGKPNLLLARPMFCSLDSYSLKKNHESIASARSIRGFFAHRHVTLGNPD